MKDYTLKTKFIIISLVAAAMGTVFLWAGTRFYMGSPQISKDRHIVIPLEIEGAKELAGVELILKYYPTVLEFKKAEKTKPAASFMHMVNDRVPGRLKIVMASAREVGEEHLTLLRLTFKVKEGYTPADALDIKPEISGVKLINWRREPLNK